MVVFCHPHHYPMTSCRANNGQAFFSITKNVRISLVLGRSVLGWVLNLQDSETKHQHLYDTKSSDTAAHQPQLPRP